MKRTFSRVMLSAILLALCVALSACGSVPANDTPLSPNDAPSVLPTVPNAGNNSTEVIPADRFPVIRANGVSVPNQLRAGGTLDLNGSVTVSRGNISQVTVTLYNAENQEIASGMLCPGGTSYQFDSTFTDITSFRSIPAGSYRMTVTVSAQDDIYANDEVVLNAPVTLY